MVQPMMRYVIIGAYAVANGLAASLSVYGSGPVRGIGCFLIAASITLSGIPALGVIFSKVP